MSTIEADADLATILADFTNYIMNERVRAFNEGVDWERERCAKIADTFAVAPREVTPGTIARSIAAAIRDIQ